MSQQEISNRKRKQVYRWESNLAIFVFPSQKYLCTVLFGVLLSCEKNWKFLAVRWVWVWWPLASVMLTDCFPITWSGNVWEPVPPAVWAFVILLWYYHCNYGTRLVFCICVLEVSHLCYMKDFCELLSWVSTKALVNIRYLIINPKPHGSGRICPHFFQRPITQKVLKCKKSAKNTYSTENVCWI